MARTLTCEIVTPERKLFSSEASFVAVTTANGEMGILPMHAPVVSTLGYGEVRVKCDEQSDPETFAVGGGYVQVNPDDHVIVLANRAVKVADVDKDVVAQELEKLEAKLAEKGEDSFLAGEVAWAKLQLKLASR